MSLIPKSEIIVNKSTTLIDKARQVVLYFYKGRLLVLLTTLAALSIYKPYALFLTLATAQTLLNIVTGTILANLVGAAVYMHNILN